MWEMSKTDICINKEELNSPLKQKTTRAHWEFPDDATLLNAQRKRDREQTWLLIKPLALIYVRRTHTLATHQISSNRLFLLFFLSPFFVVVYWFIYYFSLMGLKGHKRRQKERKRRWRTTCRVDENLLLHVGVFWRVLRLQSSYDITQGTYT